MALPGVQVNVQDGTLGLQPGSNQNSILIMGCSLGGTANTLYTLGDPVTATNALVGGTLSEAVQYCLKAAPGSTVFAMPMNPTTRGGVGSVSHTGGGAATYTPALAPLSTITISCTTAGTLGNAFFTFQLGSGPVSAPIQSAAGWSSTGFLVPGTYTNVVFTAGSYTTADVYTISAVGVFSHPAGAGPAVGTFTSSPVDDYNVLITVTTGGAVSTAQFTYSLDGGNSTSSTVTTAATYAIPGTGIYLTISGSSTAGDTYAFNSAAPTWASGDLTSALTAIETTYLSQAFYTLVAVVGSMASASAWATNVATLETAAGTLGGSNIYVRFMVGGPTVGTVLPNAGNITVDATDTDSTVITQRASMSAPHVVPCAGDCKLTSPSTGLVLRRNALWGAMARAVKDAASQDIGAYADGGIANAGTPYRDDFAQGGTFYSAGITTWRTYGAGSPTFIARGLTGTVSTSDYYPLTNARVIDLASTISVANAKQYILAKLPTQTRNGVAGTIREDAAQKIEARLNSALNAGLVTSSPQNAVAVSCVVSRTNNLFATQQLILTISVQPFGYPTTVVLNIGMTLQAS
jgi:hypothetical protein